LSYNSCEKEKEESMDATSLVERIKKMLEDNPNLLCSVTIIEEEENTLGVEFMSGDRFFVCVEVV